MTGTAAHTTTMAPELSLRFASAFVLVALALVAAWLGGWPAAIVIAALATIIGLEWAMVTEGRLLPAAVFVGLLGAAILVAAPGYLLASAGLLSVAVVGALFTGRDIWRPAGVVYAGLFGFGLLFLRFSPEFGLPAIVVLFAVVWVTDTVAYFAGKAIGGPKLWPRISPAKTWSGAACGLLAGTGAGMVAASLYGASLGMALVLVCAGLSVAAQSGDLFESWIKRRFGAKDSGTLVPGHGGLMDRVDGLTFAAALAAGTGWVLGGPVVFSAGAG